MNSGHNSTSEEIIAFAQTDQRKGQRQSKSRGRAKEEAVQKQRQSKSRGRAKEEAEHGGLV